MFCFVLFGGEWTEEVHRGFNLLLRKSKFILFNVSSAAAQSGRWGPLRRYAPAAREVSTGIFYFFSGPEMV